MIDSFTLLLIIGSAAIGLRLLLTRYRSNSPLLPHEPRRPVPWGAVAGVTLAAFLLAGTIANYATPPPADAAASAAPITPQRFAELSYADALAKVVLGAFAVTIAIMSGASRRDLGLPKNWQQATSDALLGAKLVPLTVGPVLLVQAAIIPLFGTGSQNPTLLVLQDGPGVGVILAAIVSAVLVAPVFEELVCRLLLQGWLEKVEQQLMAPRLSTPPLAADEEQPTNNLRERAEAIGLPPGTAPILISSLVFALLHLGAGPDPVPLFLFAVIQGYVYQRTHRVLPCIVNHMLFNAFALTMTIAGA